MTGYSYRQLITRPSVGSGFLTTLAIPLSASLGLLAFTITTVTLTLWPLQRSRASRV